MLEINHLAVRPAPHAPVILDDFNLAAFDNEILVLLGVSGSGKTTLLRSIAGLARVESGSILSNGIDITHAKPSGRRLSYVSQSGGYYDHWTVERHLLEALRMRSAPYSKGELESLLKTTELLPYKNAYPHQISGGQLQRLTIARAIAADQRIILLDEPLVHLDDSSKQQLLPLLTTLKRPQRSIIYVTHDRRDAMMLADRIAILDRGKILQVGKPEELYRHPTSLCAASSLGDQPLQLFNLKFNGNSAEVYWDNHLIDKKHSRCSSKGTPPTAILGVRPELISIYPKQPKSDHKPTIDQDSVIFDASLAKTKHLGATSLAYLKLSASNTLIICVMPSSNSHVFSEMQVVCSFKLRDAHIFDSESKQAITLDWT